MRVRAIHFVPDVDAARRFYAAVGLTEGAESRTGRWAEFAADGGELALHDAAMAADGEGRTGLLFSLVAEEPLESIAARLHAAGFPPEGDVVDQAWGRQLFVHAPDGTLVQIDEQDPSLYT